MSKSFIAKIEEKILMRSKSDFMDSQEKINDLLKDKYCFISSTTVIPSDVS